MKLGQNIQLYYIKLVNIVKLLYQPKEERHRSMRPISFTTTTTFEGKQETTFLTWQRISQDFNVSV